MAYNPIPADGSSANVNLFAFPEPGQIPLIALCREHDRMWGIALDNLDGSTDAQNEAVDGIMTAINSRPADSLEAAVWRGNLLARAVLNGWEPAEVARIARMVQSDAVTFGLGD